MRSLRNTAVLALSFGSTMLLVPAMAHGTPHWLRMLLQLPAILLKTAGSMLRGLGLG